MLQCSLPTMRCSLPASGCVLVWQRLTKFPGLDLELENLLLRKSWIGMLFALDRARVCGPCFENFGISKGLRSSHRICAPDVVPRLGGSYPGPHVPIRQPAVRLGLHSGRWFARGCTAAQLGSRLLAAERSSCKSGIAYIVSQIGSMPGCTRLYQPCTRLYQLAPFIQRPSLLLPVRSRMCCAP